MDEHLAKETIFIWRTGREVSKVPNRNSKTYSVHQGKYQGRDEK